MHGFTRRFFGAGLPALLALALALPTALPARAQASPSTGEVTKIDKAGGRLTLRHGGVQHLDMPPMTMAFRVADPRVLDTLAVGDRVRFTVERIQGQFTLTSVNKAP